MTVRPKKKLGQHFLNDLEIAHRIVESLIPDNKYQSVLEIGPGMGILTQFLIEKKEVNTFLIEIDHESVAYLKSHFPSLKNKIIEGDFLHFDFQKAFHEQTAIIGNFPYNISSQILFRVMEYKDLIPEVVGMFQKEVAQRIASPPGNKNYGIPSVYLQAFYNVEYLFSVDEHVFTPPPKVKSGVIRLVRKENFVLGCNEKKFLSVIKTAFNQRRKTLGNALRPIAGDRSRQLPYADKRAEQLHFGQFVELTQLIFE